MADSAPCEPKQIESARDLDGFVGLRRGRKQRGEAERGGERVNDKPGVRARLSGKPLSPAAGERARQEKRHVRPGRRCEQNASDDIGRGQGERGKKRRHGVRVGSQYQ
jgi:hypothetical protein